MTDAELAAQIQAWFAERRDIDLADQGWIFGAANGGPNGDGYYPIPVALTGETVMVPSMALLMQIAASGGKSFDAAAVAALPAANASDAAAGMPMLPGISAKDGAIKRWTTNLFAARRTQDINVLQGGEYAEWISCLTTTGLERKLAVSALEANFGGVIDPTKPPYNVKYDAQRVKPVGMQAGSNVLVAQDSVFSAARDIGKLVVVSNAGGSSAGCLFGLIGQVIDPKTVRIYSDANFTSPANAAANVSNEEAIWGTDNTIGMQAAFDAAETPGLYNIGKVVAIGGIAMVQQLRFGSISVVGLSNVGCGFMGLPQSSASPLLADKVTGVYAQYRPDNYTLKNLQIYAQRFTEYFPTGFRHGLAIRGGGFERFVRGAPYATIDMIDVREASWNGIDTFGAFAGTMTNIRSSFNAQVGMRQGFWDLNGQNWHCEANGGPGIFDVMAGGNVSLVRCSFNGRSGGGINLSGQYWPQEMGSNYVCAGYGSAITNLRCQETWCHSLLFTGYDPMHAYDGRGSKNTFTLCVEDDTGSMVPVNGYSSTRLPAYRAMVAQRGPTAGDNVVRLSTGAPQVHNTNYATNGYYDEGGNLRSIIEVVTPGITNNPADWYAGNGAAAPGPFATTSSTSIGSRHQLVSVNGVAAA